MKWNRFGLNIALVIVSSIIGILLFEVVYRYCFKQESETKHKWDQRFMLFSNENGGSAFRNIEGFFTYQPSTRIHSKTYYFVDDKWVKEYDYFIPINNFGLVQTNDIRTGVPSMLLLGDSFTEGQGAPPWFESFRATYLHKDLQLINGGLLGTGFDQWRHLHDHLLQSGIIIKRLVVVFITDDTTRRVWNVKSNIHDCIADYRRCLGDESFYGLPDDSKLDGHLEKLRSYREEYLSKKEHMASKTTKKIIGEWLPATRLVYQAAREYLQTMTSKGASQTPPSRKVIQQFIETYKSEVLFIHIPAKDEKLNHIGRKTRKDIQTYGGEYYDGYALCNLTREDYFQHDGHLNPNGYSKISACVTDAVNKKWPR